MVVPFAAVIPLEQAGQPCYGPGQKIIFETSEKFFSGGLLPLAASQHRLR
jgi:hypothetical protein